MAKYIRISLKDQADLLSLFEDGDDAKDALTKFESEIINARNENREVFVDRCETYYFFRSDWDHKFNECRFVNPDSIVQFYAESDDEK